MIILMSKESQDFINRKRQQSPPLNNLMIEIENGPIRPGEVVVATVRYGNIRSRIQKDHYIDIHPVRASSDTFEHLKYIVSVKHYSIAKKYNVWVAHNNVISREAKEDMKQLYREDNPTKKFIPKEWLLRWL